MLELYDHARRYHYVLRNFIQRDLKVKYRGTVFGYLWSLLEPLSLVLVYWFVFVVVAERGGPDYPLVVILGVLPYQFFGNVLTAGANALVGNAALIRRVYLPRDLFVLGAVGSNLVVFLLSLLVTVPFLVLFDARPGGQILVAAGALALLAALSTGLALVLACVNAVYRDVGYVLKVLLRLGFYASPVIYTTGMVPERLRPFFLLNPVAVLIEGMRAGVMGQSIPFSAGQLVYAALCSIAVLAAGASLFSRLERKAVRHL